MLYFYELFLIKLCYYVEVQLQVGAVIKALHAGAFKDALTSGTSELAADQKAF